MFFKRELATTRDMALYQKITGILRDAGIVYTTITNSPTNPGRYHGVPGIKTEVAYEYRIFVKKKDLEQARYLIG